MTVSQLSLFRPLFMVQLIVAELLFSRGFKRRKRAWWRYIVAGVVCIGITFAIPPSAFAASWCSVVYIALFSVTVAALFLIYDEPVKNIVFCAIAGYTVQHTASELYELFRCAGNLTGDGFMNFYSTSIIEFNVVSWFMLVVDLAIYFLTYMFVGMFLAPRVQKSGIMQMNSVTVLLLASFIVIIDIVFGTIMMYVLPSDTDKGAMLMLHVYNIMCCVLAMILLFELPKRKVAEVDLGIIKQLRYREREKYRLSKESIDLINIKCHDLKHRIRAMSGDTAALAVNSDALEKAVQIYDTAYQTKNEALNVVLMEKGLICNKNGINLACIADAEKLCFMNEEDVYSLFGNLLDNAIEATGKLPVDSRSIGLNIKCVNSFLSVNVYNSYAGELIFDGGLPRTTKHDTDYHGYGMKSIKYIVDKYGGEMKINANKGIFDVNILFDI